MPLDPKDCVPLRQPDTAPRQYQKKPVVIWAIPWTGHNAYELSIFLEGTNSRIGSNQEPDTLFIHTLEGTMRAEIGDWIIKGVKGEFYPCRDDIFQATYEECNAT